MIHPTRILLTAAFSLLSVLISHTGYAQTVQIPAAKSTLLPTFGHVVTLTYSLTALPILPGNDGELATDINNQGTVIGEFNPGGAGFWASWEYAHGQYTFVVPPTASNYINDINNRGVMIGSAWNGQAYVGFAYFNGKTTAVNPITGSPYTWPSGINDLGQIVATVRFPQTPGYHDHIFLMQPNGTYVDLGDFGWYPLAFINNQGTIIITGSNSTDTLISAYVRQPGSAQLQQIPPLVPGAAIELISINNLGVIAGTSYLDTTSSISHAIVYAHGKRIDLGTLPSVGTNPGGLSSWAECINTRGQVVGNASQAETQIENPTTHKYETLNPGYEHGFIYYDGVMHDLNAMTPASTNGWVVTQAWSINDEGKIVASAGYQGAYPQPVILTPNAILP